LVKVLGLKKKGGNTKNRQEITRKNSGVAARGSLRGKEKKRGGAGIVREGGGA